MALRVLAQFFSRSFFNSSLDDYPGFRKSSVGFEKDRFRSREHVDSVLRDFDLAKLAFPHLRKWRDRFFHTVSFFWVRCEKSMPLKVCGACFSTFWCTPGISSSDRKEPSPISFFICALPGLASIPFGVPVRFRYQFLASWNRRLRLQNVSHERLAVPQGPFQISNFGEGE